jgi:hypothetical protein
MSIVGRAGSTINVRRTAAPLTMYCEACGVLANLARKRSMAYH